MVISQDTTVYIQKDDVPGIHYPEGSQGVIYDEWWDRARTPDLQNSDLKRAFYENIQDNNWKPGDAIKLSWTNRRSRTAAMHITLDCITGENK